MADIIWSHMYHFWFSITKVTLSRETGKQASHDFQYFNKKYSLTGFLMKKKKRRKKLKPSTSAYLWPIYLPYCIFIPISLLLPKKLGALKFFGCCCCCFSSKQERLVLKRQPSKVIGIIWIISFRSLHKFHKKWMGCPHLDWESLSVMWWIQFGPREVETDPLIPKICYSKKKKKKTHSRITLLFPCTLTLSHESLLESHSSVPCSLLPESCFTDSQPNHTHNKGGMHRNTITHNTILWKRFEKPWKVWKTLKPS